MQSRTSAPNGVEVRSQKAWDSKCIPNIKDGLMANALSNKDKARLIASQAPHSDDWLFAILLPLPLAWECQMRQFAWSLLCDLELDYEWAWHILVGSVVDARGPQHGLSSRRSAGRHNRHSQLNDIIWRNLCWVYKYHRQKSHLAWPEVMEGVQMASRFCHGHAVNVWCGM